MTPDKYYVYVYIDPRDFTEFYYGKGLRDRKRAHLLDNSDSEKTKIIREINKAGLRPIIRVIAKDLSEEEAFLVEKTLIWKLGRTLANVSSGKFKNRFRPHKTLHCDLYGFDYQRGLYYFNIGDVSAPGWRDWDDMRRLSFITAGGDNRYSDHIRRFHKGDIFCAYRSRSGYVGIGMILQEAVPYRLFKFRGKPLSAHSIDLDLGHDSHNYAKCEWLCSVKWFKAVPSAKAKWELKSGLYSKQAIRASLQDQPRTVHFLERAFAVNFDRILRHPIR